MSDVSKYPEGSLEHDIAMRDGRSGKQSNGRPGTAIIQLDEQGLMTPRDSLEDSRVAKMMLETNVLPTCFQTVPQVILAVQMVRGLGLLPSIAMRQVMVINNVLAIWGELPKAACQRHIETFEEFRYDKDYVPIEFKNKNLGNEAIGAVMQVKRRDFISPTESYFTLDMAKQAGLMNKKGPWQQYTDVMLKFRARSRGLKDLFADVLNGVPIAEYDYNILDGRGAPTFGDANGTADALAGEINSMGEIVDAPTSPARQVRSDA
jgi:RecT family